MANENVTNRPLLLKGIGHGFIKTVDGNILEMKTSQSMTVNTTTSTDNQYGGDGLFPLWTYITSKECSIEITNAEFQLAQLAIAQGVNISKAGNKVLKNYLITKESSNVSVEAITGCQVVGCVAPSGKNIEVATEAGDDVLSIGATGDVAFGSSFEAEAGEYSVWCKIDATTAVTAELLKDAMCRIGEFHWSFTTEDMDGERYQIDLFAKRVRSNGEFTIETGRESASTPTLTVNVLDPGNGDKNFMHVTVSTVTA